MRCIRNFLLSCFLTTISINQVCADCSQCCREIFQETEVEFSYNFGNYISIDENYFEIGLFAPLALSDSYTTFLDLNGYRFDDGKWASSTGLGIRKDLSERGALGINLYYEYRRGESKNDFHQIGFGGEWLNQCWDIRINGYLPVWRKTQTSQFCAFNHLRDGFFATRRRIEYAYSGFDAEIGGPLLDYCDFNLYGAIGPYYYAHSHQHHFWGGHGRLELDWKSILSLKIRISSDKVYSTNAQGIIQVSFPIDFCWENWKSHCLINQKARRNGVILTDHCCDWTWNWDDKN